MATTRNPPWVDSVLDSHWDQIAAAGIPPDWMPTPKARRRGSRRKFEELGCGHYGCVLETADPRIVMKVTTDESEAAFVAAYLKLRMPLLGMIRYHAIRLTPERRKGKRVYVIWRDAATWVGDAVGWALEKGIAHEFYVREAKQFYNQLYEIRAATNQVRQIIVDRKKRVGDYRRVHDDLISPALSEENMDKVWKAREQSLASGKTAHYQYMIHEGPPVVRLGYWMMEYESLLPELARSEFGNYIAETFIDLLGKKIMLADVHQQNVGVSDSSDPECQGLWVITDPGHMVPLAPQWNEFTVMGV